MLNKLIESSLGALALLGALIVLNTALAAQSSMEIKPPKPTPQRPVVKPLKPWQQTKVKVAGKTYFRHGSPGVLNLGITKKELIEHFKKQRELKNEQQQRSK
jgi:hypothetical protein